MRRNGSYAPFSFSLFLPQAVLTVLTPPLPLHRPLHLFYLKGSLLSSGSELLPVQTPELSVKSGEESPNDLKVAIQEKALAPSPSPESSQSLDNPTKTSVTSNTDLEVLDYVEEEGEQEKVGDCRSPGALQSGDVPF